MKIAISGAGIAGPCLAYWLHRTGHQPTLIEKAPRFRTGGYLIDFWGVGYTVAEKMGILPEVLKAGYLFGELRLVDKNGRKAGGFSTAVFHRMTHGRFVSLPRGDLAAAIYRAIENRIETHFDSSISAIEESDNEAHVTFEDGSSRDFDLIIGAGGLHSKVRQLAFGPEQEFEKQLGFRVATFEAMGYSPRDELVYVAHVSPGRQVARIALRGDRTMFLFVFRDELLNGSEPSGLAEPRALLRDVFGDAGWETPEILGALAGDIYFDRVSQIVMPSWSKGRVMLIGDAASAVSLLAGEGTGIAMTAAYVLAGELQRAGDDFRTAFRNCEMRLRPFVEEKQKEAVRFASSFAPKTQFGIWVRNQATRLMRVPKLADLLIGHMVIDHFDLPDYSM
jgi:2-polyprenyl-6-methoxyphenol hydroxylase-like FAD-dependent oxidoreductase